MKTTKFNEEVLYDADIILLKIVGISLILYFYKNI